MLYRDMPSKYCTELSFVSVVYVGSVREPISRISALPESSAQVCSASSQVGEGLVLGCKGNAGVRETTLECEV